jgi:hypothetical protein
MSRVACTAPLTSAALLAYWLGESDAAEDARVEEHFLGCAACGEQLAELVALRDAVRDVARDGSTYAVVSDGFVQRLVAHGLRVREYRVPQNGAVSCTVTPQDDLVVARLAAPLEGVKRLDLVQIVEGHGPARLEDVPFDAAAGGVVVTSQMPALRSLPASRNRMQLIAVDDSGAERLVGEYTFNHTPFAA